MPVLAETYAASGVDLAAAEAVADRIKHKAQSTYRPEVVGELGGFGGLFAIPTDRYRQPVLVATTDGVGTKATVAKQAGRFDTIGIDLVAMCVDDLVCQGAEPLFFLDYVAVGHLDPQRIDQIMSGLVEGCRQARCALIGGETAEHPGAMAADEFDLAGFAVGIVERDRILTGETARSGDALVGLASPGLRSNGYSLARRVLFERAGLRLDDELFPGHSVGEELLRPSLIYTPAIIELLADVEVRGIAHVTGGGLPGNLPRVLPDGLDAIVDGATWEVPRVFLEIQRLGGIDDAEMARVFNLGIGMVLVVPPAEAQRTVARLGSAGHAAAVVGRLVDGGSRQVRWASPPGVGK